MLSSGHNMTGCHTHELTTDYSHELIIKRELDNKKLEPLAKQVVINISLSVFLWGLKACRSSRMTYIRRLF